MTAAALFLLAFLAALAFRPRRARRAVLVPGARHLGGRTARGRFAAISHR